MSVTLTPEIVRQIAVLAQLELTDDEVSAFTPQLEAILAYARAVQTVDTTGVPPTTHAGLAPRDLRADEVAPSLPRDEAVQNAPESAASTYFKVPQVMGG
jgi:aspartyl-tRNA(Asn)/glutamyl-tRNA(Gln) amidotransferase subunit C